MQKQFVYLILLVLSVAAGVYYIYIDGEQTKAANIESQARNLIEQSSINLAATGNEQGNIDSIQKIELFKASTVLISAVFENDQWLTYQEGSSIGFPLQMQPLVSLIRALRDAVIVEPKSANPKNHARLGLSAVNNAGSDSVLLRITTENNSIEILIGNEATLQNGQYVRFNDSDQMLLIDKMLNVPENSASWLQKSLFSFSVDDVVSVEQQSDLKGSLSLVNKKKETSSDLNEQPLTQLRFEGESFTLDDLQSSEQIAYPNIVGNYVSTLAKLKFNSLMALDAPASRNYKSAAILKLRTYSDQLFVIDVLENKALNQDDQDEQALSYLVKIESPNNNDYVNEWFFVISNEQAQNILKSRNDFLASAKSSKK